MSKRLVITILTLIVIISTAGVAVFLAKGYTFSPQQRMILGTGIITVTSIPDAASVFIDGHLTTATNATIPSLAPKSYNVKVVKEGFIPWERTVDVKEGLVADLKISLFPAIPTMYPLTFNGVLNPILSPDSGKLAFIVPSGKKAGVWVWQLVSDQPIAFARGAEPHQIVLNTPVDYSKATLKWSSDSKQVLATVGTNNYLLNENSLNTDPKDITPTIDATLKSWEDDRKIADSARIVNIKDVDVRKIASESAVVRWSPDETKFLYRKDPLPASPVVASGKVTPQTLKVVGGFKVYDLETSGDGSSKKSYDIPDAIMQFWLPDSRHIVLVEEDKISVVDFDGTNKAVIYAGKFDNNFVFAWPDSSKLVFITSFPTPTASEPNLYGVNLK